MNGRDKSSSSRDDSNVAGQSSSSSSSSSSAPRSNKRRRESTESQNMEFEKSLKSLVEMQVVTMETQVSSMESLAQKIPSDQKLPQALKKIREVLAEYKSESTGNFSNQAENNVNGAGQTGDKELKILKLIEKYVNFSENGEPSNSRPVSEMWDSKSKELFFKDDFLQLPPDFHSEMDKIIYRKFLFLDELKEWFSGLSLGCISKVVIKRKTDFKLFSDLQILGEQIHTIKIDLSTLKSVDYSQLVDSIIKNCANLTLLDIQEKGGVKLTRGEKSLFGLAFMEACANNQQLLNKNRRNREPLTISTLVIELCLNDLIEFRPVLNSVKPLKLHHIYDNCCYSGVRVNHLTIFHSYLDENFLRFNRLIQFVAKILESSKDALRHFTYDSNLFQNILNRVKAPVMPNLHTLEITAPIDSSLKSVYFQQGFQFSVHAPNLKTVYLNLHPHPCALNFREQESIGGAPSVKTLRFQNYGGHDSQLEIFQQVEELSFSWAHGKAASIWKCKNLKKLNIFNVYSSTRDSLVRLLAGLTGRKEEDFEGLWKKSSSFWGGSGDGDLIMDLNLIEKIRPSIGTGSSIVELQDLESLVIKVDRPFSCERLKENFLVFFQALIADSMPKLEKLLLVEEAKPFLTKLKERRIEVCTAEGRCYKWGEY